MANDENKIILEFPATNVEIEFGETITFDNISGFLNSDRVTYNGESLTEEIAHLEDSKAEKTYVDEELDKKADKDTTYTKTEVNTRLNNKMDKSNPTGTGKLSVGSNILNLGQGSHALGSDILTYGQNTLAVGKGTGAASDNQFVFGKYNQQDWSGNYVEVVGNGTNGHPSNARTLDWQGNEMLAGDLIFNRSFSLTQKLDAKADKSNTYTKTEVDTLIDNLPEPMIFKGTLGVNGTIQSLPDASASNEGFTYKVITDGTYAGQPAKVGDVFTSNGSAWVYIPSGDEDNDTWRAIKVEGVEKLGNGISSGAVDFVGSENIEVEFDGNGNKVGVKTKNIYTKEQVDDIVYNILPDDTASGSVANFDTSLEMPLKSLEVDVNAVQESGTPTPATPLPISGWNAITLDVNGTTEVINLGGTYYGGHFTQDKAGHRQFVVTHGYGQITKATNKSGTWDTSTGKGAFWYNTYAGGIQWLRLWDNSATNNGIVCDTLPLNSNVTAYNTDCGISIYTNEIIRWIDVEKMALSLADYNTYLAEHPINVCYPLKTPIVIDLPDGEPITTHIGTNNIYADTGDCAVEYKVSVEQYVSNHSGGGGAKSLGGVFLGGSNSGSEEEPKEDTEEPKEVTKTLGDEPISKK